MDNHKRLIDLTDDALTYMIETSIEDFSFNFLLSIRDDTDTIEVGTYVINKQKNLVYGNSVNCYSVTDAGTNECAYRDINLLETAVFVVKELYNKKPIYPSNQIIAMDQQYGRYLNDYLRLVEIMKYKTTGKYTIAAKLDRCHGELLSIRHRLRIEMGPFL